MEGNPCFLTASGSTEIIVLALFLLFATDTVIFEEQPPFRQSSRDGRWSQTRGNGLTLLLLLDRSGFVAAIGSQSHHGM